MIGAYYSYRVDADDRIREVDAAWLDFAIENDAPELTAEAVLGRSLWDFVDGDAICKLYGMIFASLRAKPSEVKLPFRCDSPTRIRQMLMTLRSERGGGIAMETQLFHSEERAPVLLFDRKAPRSPEGLPICSVCLRVGLSGEWVDAAEAVVRRRLFSQERPPRLDETVCPDCFGAPR